MNFPTTGNIPYRVIRQPRVLPGEPALPLTEGAAIDTSASFPLNSTLAGGPLDILFTPSGSISLMGAAAASSNVVLWVRDVTQDGLVDDQALITVYARSGSIAAYPVDTSTSTALSANAAAGTATISVANSGIILSGMYLLVDAGAAAQEIVTVQGAPAGNVVTIAAPLSYAHGANAPVMVNPYSFTQQALLGGM
jgi:hypothetical protein